MDEPALRLWLQQAVPGSDGEVTVTKFQGGQSNPTYLLRRGATQYVLRRKPFGTILPSAHAIEREYLLLKALSPTGFPVPTPIVLCEDSSIIGVSFFVMEMIHGRSFWDGTLPEIAPAARRPLYEAMIDTLALLHNIDHIEIGLKDFARPGSYVTRQVTRWTRQYRAAQTDVIPEIEKLIEWLPRSVPEQDRQSIIHGDYRIDNLIYARDAPAVVAVLDWELATVGDPIADFAYLAMNWELQADGRSGLAGIDLRQQGLPTLGEATAHYCAATNRDSVPNLQWYFAYNIFRLVGILQGVKKRMLDGNASSASAQEMADRIIPLAQTGWEQARRAGAR